VAEGCVEEETDVLEELDAETEMLREGRTLGKI
jgi:hypothetical protein